MKSFLEIAKESIDAQAQALILLSSSLSSTFETAINLIVGCEGKIVLSGIGKSGHVASKIASTLSSTGAPAIFLHPSEASHGDLGMVNQNDLVVAISRSGESKELYDLIHYSKQNNISVIGITQKSESTLAKLSNVVLELPNIPEVCPMGLAPTTSTTMTLVLGDALAIGSLVRRDFKASEFHQFHPGGKLGAKLTQLGSVMHRDAKLPLVHRHASIVEAVVEMTRCRFGCTGIVGDDGELIGIFTDGDLRRNISCLSEEKEISEIMTEKPTMVPENMFVVQAVSLMTEKKIPSLFVCENEKPIGIVHIHDLF